MQIKQNQDIVIIPDSKGHGANMGPTWDRQDPGGPHIGDTNFAIWDTIKVKKIWNQCFL